MGPAEISFDLLVIGGGPAGCAAAITGARRGLHVGLVSAPSGVSPCLGWVSPAAVRLAGELGVTAESVAAEAWRGVRIFTWDFRKSVTVDEAELAGWLVARPTFDEALRQAARYAGAKFIPSAPRELLLAEDAARLPLDSGSALSGRVAVIADGSGSQVAQRIGLLPARPGDARLRGAYAVIAAGSAQIGIDLVLGPGRSQPVALLARGSQEVRAWLLTRDAGAPDSQLRELLSAAAVEGVIPAAPAPRPVKTPVLAGAALDLDQHVGKRCLLVGDAGGFVSALSNEGLYPGMKSGQLAAEVAAEALSAPVLQDVLAGFEAAWRAALAEYMRLPNSDLGLLLPLVFNNPQMSRRVARAFLLGETF